MNKFGSWLLKEIESRDMSQSDLARACEITTAQMSRIISGERNAGKETIAKIARAFKLPPETVFRAAGLLPPQSPENEIIEQITHLTQELPTYEQQDILEFVKMRHRLAEERGKNEKRRSKERTLTTE